MSVIATESLSCSTGIHTNNRMNSSANRSGLLQEFVKNPLSLLYGFYQNAASLDNTTINEEEFPSTIQEEKKEGEGKVTYQRRLHPKAESCKSSLMAGTASVVLKKPSNGETESNSPQLTDLPVGVILHLASFLDAKSLCHLQQTCRHFHSLMGDELLWRRKLLEDSHQWPVLGHLSHPRVYEETSTELSAQEIYGNCYVNRDSIPTQNSFSYPVINTLRSLMHRLQGRIPRLLMFGSGLESIPLVRLMIMEKDSPYQPVGLFPGKEGVGSGLCIKHKDTSINLVTLYTATKAERKATVSGQGKRINKLISAYNEDNQNAPELTAAVQEQCQLADGFLLVVNASNLDEEALELDTTILKAMLHSASSKHALIVLACQYQEDDEAGSVKLSDSSLDIADKLKLCDISCPWQVRYLNLNTFDGLADGLDWILAATNNS